MSATNEQKIELLTLARERIASGSKYICVSIVMLTHYKARPDLENARLALQSYIYDALGVCATLDEWLRERDGHWWRDADVRAARLQWIDWMIEQLRE
jgi:hypothetical protein